VKAYVKRSKNDAADAEGDLRGGDATEYAIRADQVGRGAKRPDAPPRKERLGGISKMGDRYLRYLLVVGAIAVVRYTHRKTTAISIWANRLLERKSARMVTVVVANKMARIAWAVMARNENYRAPSVAA
jgi:transposase